MKNFDIDFKQLEATSDLLKALAHPVRLCIVRSLTSSGPCNVSNMHSCLNLPQSTVSQHVSKLKAAGIIKGIRNGTEIVYEISDTRILKLIECIF